MGKAGHLASGLSQPVLVHVSGMSCCAAQKALAGQDMAAHKITNERTVFAGSCRLTTQPLSGAHVKGPSPCQAWRKGLMQSPWPSQKSSRTRLNSRRCQLRSRRWGCVLQGPAQWHPKLMFGERRPSLPCFSVSQITMSLSPEE